MLVQSRGWYTELNYELVTTVKVPDCIVLHDGRIENFHMPQKSNNFQGGAGELKPESLFICDF